MSEEEISNELKVLDLKLSDLEVKGVKLEEMLRFAMEPGEFYLVVNCCCKLRIKKFMNIESVVNNSSVVTSVM